MKLLPTLVGLLGAVFTMGMGHPPEGPAPADRQFPYIDRIDAPPRIHVGDTLNVVIEGNLPTPAWALETPEVKRDDHRVRICLTMFMRDKQGVSIQMLQPFVKSVPLAGLKAGAWTIEVMTGPDAHIDTQVQVDPAKPAARPSAGG